MENLNSKQYIFYVDYLSAKRANLLIIALRFRLSLKYYEFSFYLIYLRASLPLVTLKYIQRNSLCP